MRVLRQDSLVVFDFVVSVNRLLSDLFYFFVRMLVNVLNFVFGTFDVLELAVLGDYLVVSALYDCCVLVAQL